MSKENCKGCGKCQEGGSNSPNNQGGCGCSKDSKKEEKPAVQGHNWTVVTFDRAEDSALMDG